MAYVVSVAINKENHHWNKNDPMEQCMHFLDYTNYSKVWLNFTNYTTHLNPAKFVSEKSLHHKKE